MPNIQRVAKVSKFFAALFIIFEFFS